MNKIFDTIRSFLASLAEKRKSGQKPTPVINDPVPAGSAKVDRFTLISWACTAVIVAGLLISTLLYKNSHAAGASPSAQATSEASDTGLPQAEVPAQGSGGDGMSFILRKLDLKTIIPERPRYNPVTYRVSRGDAMLSIADEFKIKSETILYVNKQLEDNPHNLKPGMELTIPPVDGLYYEWKDGDTFESVADKFDTSADEIINFPGNNVDLTDPKIAPGALVMIPGGSRELRNWEADLTTASRSNNGSTGTSDFGGNACGGGPVASGFGWPADAHSLSGNGYGPGHLGIDITAPEGSNVYAAGSGVVTMAQGGYNYGYGNVVQIDHGNGYVTVYAHLSQINVSPCQSVGQGTLIGYSGNTGNSFGAHLHFEIRVGGKNINPYDIVQ
ncbi:MAG: peptidoglycan DD-metalloendopeptidase family protein [Chloroflexi bacterium]|nr:peptidoglycan DD-metalloendopeptidase family protein [Chloroflexota bacterium]